MGRDNLGGDDYTSKRKGGLRDFDGYDNVDYNKDMLHKMKDFIRCAKEETFRKWI